MPKTRAWIVQQKIYGTRTPLAIVQASGEQQAIDVFIENAKRQFEEDLEEYVGKTDELIAYELPHTSYYWIGAIP